MALDFDFNTKHMNFPCESVPESTESCLPMGGKIFMVSPSHSHYSHSRHLARGRLAPHEMVLDDSPCAKSGIGWSTFDGHQGISGLNNSNKLNRIGRLLELTNLKKNESLLY